LLTGKKAAIRLAIDALLGVVDEVFPIELVDVNDARNLVLTGRLSARDALHVAVIQRHGIARIMTFDTDLAVVPGIAPYTGAPRT
jgi:predicted nucleic acid-binding protein